jgi:hypothetical protein
MFQSVFPYKILYIYARIIAVMCATCPAHFIKKSKAVPLHAMVALGGEEV